MKYSKWWGVALAALLTLTSVNCSQEATPENEEPEPITLEIVGDQTIMLGFKETRTISVRARYKSDGSPVSDRKVSFLITGAANGATLSEQEVYTDDAGNAATDIKAGEVKAQFFVKASSSNAKEVQFAIDVNGADIGSLRVYYGVPDKVSINFSKLSTRIHPEPLFDCANFNDWSTLPESQATQDSLSASIPVLFPDLHEGDRFTISVIGYGPEGNEIAHGCKQSAAIIGRKIIDESVDLTLLPTSFTGTYQMATKLDLLSVFKEADSWRDENGNVSAVYIVRQVLNFFENPGKWIFDFAASFAENSGNTIVQYIPSFVDAAAGIGAQAFCTKHDGQPDPINNEEPDGDMNSDTKMFYWDYRSTSGNHETIRYSCSCMTGAVDAANCGTNANTCGPEHNDNCSTYAKGDSIKAREFINILVFGYSPSWVGSIFEVGNSISAMVQNLVVGGEFEITKSQEDPAKAGNYTLEGEERWNSYMFTWTLGKNCSPNDKCCGETVFGAGNSVNNKLDAASGKFTGRAKAATITGQSAYELVIDEHVLSLNYGKIIMYVLKNVAFPAITKMDGVVTFNDVLMKLIPVENVACWLGSLSFFGGVAYDTCMPTCHINPVKQPDGSYIWDLNCGSIANTVVQLIKAGGDVIDDKVNSLSVSGTENYNLKLQTNDTKSATNLLIDTNQDLQADHLAIDLQGNIYLGQNSASIKGTMEAEFARVITPNDPFDRTTCHSDKQCVDAIGEGRTCQIREGLVSKCAERMICALNVGSYVAGAACMNNEDCQSGFCMQDTKTCYSACSASSDCTAASAPVCNSNVSYTFKNDNVNAIVSGCKAN